MSVLFIGKRFYTNRDALHEKYGRIYQLPWHWAQAGIPTRLWLVDYHACETRRERDGKLDIVSTPVRNLALFRYWLSGAWSTDGRPDVVIGSGDCYIGWMAWRIARRTNARFVFDVYDKYDEFPGYHSPPGFDLFSFLLRKADTRLFASRALMERVDELQRSALVPNGIDTMLFRPMDKDACRTEMGLTEDAVYVGYVGSMTADRGADELIAAVQLLRDDGLDVRVLLAGQKGVATAWSQSFVTYLGNVPYASVPTVMGCCDVLALPYRRSDYLDMASSCKIAEYIAIQRPLAATETPNLALNFPAARCQLAGLLAEPSNSRDLARVIAAQLVDPRLVAMPTGFSWRFIADQISSDIDLGGTPGRHDGVHP